MALNDIIVPKENAQGTFDETVLTAGDLKLGTTANLPLKTGSGGVIEAGSFGTAAGSFCEGNDARLSDARTPSSTLAHKASHATGGTDALSPADIGAAATSHTHAAADITSGTLDIARLPVGTATNTVAAGDDSRFSDIPDPSAATPQALGTAAAGTSNDFARADHVHAMPSASDVGAAADDDARLTDTRDPNAHAASHAAGGTDELFDQSLNTDDRPAFAGIDVIEGQNIKLVDTSENEATISFIDGNAIEFATNETIVLNVEGGENPIVNFNAPFQFLDDNDGAKKSATRDNLGLGDSATADIGTGAGEVAAGDHTHELADLAATGITAGKVLAADGDDGAEWVDAPSGGSGEVRSDFVSPYAYTGLAPAGTSESTASWTIRRSEFDAGGSFVATLTASAVQWANRLTASYA
jgi:hypothetical protein